MSEPTDRDHKFLPDQVPTSLTRELFITYGIGEYNQGEVSIWDFDIVPVRSASDDKYALVTLHQQFVTFQLPAVTVNVNEKKLEVLFKQKEKVLAENHQRLKEVQEKIDKLLAIEGPKTSSLPAIDLEDAIPF